MRPALTRAMESLSSIRFARGLLIAIGFVALIGTVIPQQEEQATCLSRFGTAGTDWLTRLSLTDLYHSWYFIGLLVLLGVSLVVRSIRRWSASLRILGSIVLHLSFVLIIAGGIIKYVAGVEGVAELLYAGLRRIRRRLDCGRAVSRGGRASEGP